MKVDRNCARVWLRIIIQLSSTDVKTMCMMAQRSEIFELRYESTDSFLSFYSTTKGLIHKLKTNKSITVTDETFLKSYFAKVTKAPALQQEVKKFIKGGSNTYDEILEFIHLDYRAQEMGEVLRDNVTHPTKPSSLC